MDPVDAAALPKETVSAIFAAQAAHETDADVQATVAAAIANYLGRAVTTGALVALHAETIVKKLLNRGVASGACRLICGAANALHCLSRFSDSRASVVAAGGVTALVSCLRKFAADAQVAVIVSCALALLSADREVALLLLATDGKEKSKSGAIAALVATMRAQRCSYDVSLPACEYAGQLCISAEACADILSKGLAGLVFAAAAVHKGDRFMAKSTCQCFAVARIAEYPCAREHASAGGAGLLVARMLGEHAKECPLGTIGSIGLDVAATGCAAVRNLCNFPAHRRELMAAGLGVGRAIIQLTRVNVDTVKFAAMSALFALACEPANCADLHRNGAGGVAAMALSELRGDSPTEWARAWAACGVLLRLCDAAAADGDDARLLDLDEDDVGEILLLSVIRFKAELRILNAAGAALRKLVTVRSIRDGLAHRFASIRDTDDGAVLSIMAALELALGTCF